MMFDETQLLKSYHDAYCRLTGQTLTFRADHMFAWREFSLEYSREDLELVVKHIRKKHPDRQKQLNCFRFSWFIGRPDLFAEDLSEARALARRPVRDADRESVLRATGRSTPEPDRVRSAADIIAGLKAFEEFKRLKQLL